jgi:hypothetical protein
MMVSGSKMKTSGFHSKPRVFAQTLRIHRFWIFKVYICFFVMYSLAQLSIHIYIYITHLDLHLALFSAHSSFCLDLRSF